MLRKPITYTDFDGEEKTEIFYFNLTKAELFEWEAETDEGIVKIFQRIIDTTDRKGLISIFKTLIMRSYGIKSEDGKRFIKNDKLREEFSQTAAYDVLYMELATDNEGALTFISGVFPQDIVQGVDLKQLTAEKLGAIQNNLDNAKDEAKTDTPEPTPPTN